MSQEINRRTVLKGGSVMGLAGSNWSWWTLYLQ